MLQETHEHDEAFDATGDAKLDRNRLVDPKDNYLDRVNVLRDEYGADIVVLLVEFANDPNTGKPVCGWSYIMDQTPGSWFEKYAYSVVIRHCAAGDYSFAHEIGHLMSARHDWIQDPKDNKPFAFNHGHLNTAPTAPGVGKWVTMMSYRGSCGPNCSRIETPGSQMNGERPAGRYRRRRRDLRNQRAREQWRTMR